MKNEINLNYLESLRVTTLEKINNTPYPKQKLSFLFIYFEQILKTNNNNIKEAFLSEFIETYVDLIGEFEIWGVEPNYSLQLIEQLKKISDLKFLTKYQLTLRNQLTRIEQQYESLIQILEGKESVGYIYTKANFPLVYKDSLPQIYGIIDSITIRISKATNRNKFILIPSEVEIEKTISEQINISWELAIKLLKKYVRKPYPFHEVIISFDKREGIYEGNSLGLALSLAMLEELLKFYNPTYQIIIANNTAFTGGIDIDGNVRNTGEEIIKKKIHTIFFSPVKNFVFQKHEESYAFFALTQLQKIYPNRKLKLIAVEDINDVLNRRDLLKIKKVNPVIRTRKYIQKNRVVILLLFVLSVVLYLTNWWDFDSNPQLLIYENNQIKVCNSNKTLLWSTKTVPIPDYFIDKNCLTNDISLLYDINDDGTNEVILTKLYLWNELKSENREGIICFDNKRQTIWQFRFDKQVTATNLSGSTNYLMSFIGVHKEGDKKILYVIARNEYFPTAVFGLDLNTGKIVTDIFWHSGHLAGGILFQDVNKKQKIFLAGINNGYECVAVMSLDLDNLSGQAIAPENYVLKDIPPAKLDKYLIIPKTDYAEYNGLRYNFPLFYQIKYYSKDKLLTIKTCESETVGEIAANIQYNFNLDLSLNSIETADYFQLERDKLVRGGKLSYPLTYTPEYFQMLKDSIKYWDGNKFISLKELKK